MTHQPSLFDVPVRVPDIRTPAPSAPGSDTSQAAADALSGPFRRRSWRLIMLTLAAADPRPLSMHELSTRTELPINVLCARLSIDELRPTWVEVVPGACASHVKPELRVNGYRLTAAGRARVGGR